MFLIEEFVGETGEKVLAFININRCVDVVEAGEHALHIAVDHGMGQVECYGSYGGGGVIADSFQMFEFFKIGGKLAVVFVHDLLCAMVQVAGARIVT